MPLFTRVSEPGCDLVDKFEASYVELRRSAASRLIAADVQRPGHGWSRQVAATARRRGVLEAVPFHLLLLMLCLVAEVFRRRSCRHIAVLFLVSLRTESWRCWQSVFIKPGTHWEQNWIQHGRLCWTFNFVAGNKVERSTKSTVLNSTMLPVCTRLNFYGKGHIPLF